MPNINFKTDSDEFDITQKPQEQATEPEWSRALKEEREYLANQLAQQQANANRKMSELYEQAQIQNRAMLELMKRQAPEPDYSSNDSYFKDSYNTSQTSALTEEQVKEMARQAAEETFRNTVQKGTEVHRARSTRENELAQFFQEKCTDLHPYKDKVLKLYQQAQANFPNATVDDQFSWALQTARDFVADLSPQKQTQQSPVGRHGNTRPTENHVSANDSAKSDREILTDYYQELSEIEQSIDEAFDM